MSTNDHVASGNWGLHDQKLALEWVRTNIASFSGDPNAITIFGQGAGAASVIYHVISPLSQGLNTSKILFEVKDIFLGLFHRAIAQSGSALCEWALEREPLQFAREVAQTVGCPTDNSIDLVECLRRTHYSEILRAQSKGKVYKF